MGRMIYHYTTIESLRLILENKSLRLSRLDLVDDPEEWLPLANGANPSKYVFVSSWTREDREMIPQWKMYGGYCHGVRIGMDEDCLLVKRVGKFRRLVDLRGDHPDAYRMSSSDDDSFLSDIQYVPDPRKCIHEDFGKISLDRHRSMRTDLVALNEQVARYKSEIWSFQRECRFSVAAFPRVDGARSHPAYIMQDGVEAPVPWIDVLIKPECLKKAEILLGPCVTDEEKREVALIMDVNLNRKDYKCSRFSGIMNDWGYLGPSKYYVHTNSWGEETFLKLITTGKMQDSMQNMAVLQELNHKKRVVIVPLISLLNDIHYRKSNAGEARKIAN